MIHHIRVAGRRLRISFRPGEGRALLLCNGIGASLDLLGPFVRALDPTIPVVRFDPPGIGGSQLSRTPYSYSWLTHLLTGVLDDLGIGDFDVLGISWGGALAQQVAFQCPRRCRHLVLAATATGWMMVPARPQVLAKLISPRRHRDAGYVGAVAAELYGGSFRTRPRDAARVLRSDVPHTSRLGYAFQLAAASGWASLPFLPLIRQPTLILAGADDPIIPLVNARMMQRLLPNASLHVYDDGHLGLLTQAADLGPRVSRFLRPGAAAGWSDNGGRCGPPAARSG